MTLKFSNTIFSAILFGLIFCSSCSGNKQDAHTHEEGRVCKEDVITEQSMPDQESFKVEADSNAVHTDTINHDHNHDHDDGHNHNHRHTH